MKLDDKERGRGKDEQAERKTSVDFPAWIILAIFRGNCRNLR